MCRYSEHNYKHHFACFDCRRTVKMSYRDPNSPAVVCPECAKEMHWLGRDFAAPTRTNDLEWRALEILVRAGIVFDSCGCDGPGYRPTTPREARKMVENRKRDPIKAALRSSDIRNS